MDRVVLGHVADHAAELARLACTSTPSKRTDPAVGAATPAIASNSVVLPAPLGPTMATSSPGAIDNDAASRSVISPAGEPDVPRDGVDLDQEAVGGTAAAGGVASGAGSSVVVGSADGVVSVIVLLNRTIGRT